MDQHPIPQNVTGFQFKLIGAMTVKQFGYVAAGVIGAAIVYYMPLPGFFGILFKIILIPIFGASGPILAFIPIDGRPIDVMAGNFLKALLSPNQYIYRKGVKAFSFSTIQLSKPRSSTQTAHDTSTPKQKMINERGRELQKLLIKSSQGKIKNDQDARENAFLNSILETNPASTPLPVGTPASPTLPQAPTNTPANTPQKETIRVNTSPLAGNPTPEILSEKEAALKKQLEFAKKEEASPHDPKAQADIHQKTLDLEKQVQEVHAQKQLLEQEIIKLKQQLSSQQATPPGPVSAASKPENKPAPQAAQKTSSHVRSVPKDLNKRLGIFVSDTPNVVSGMVKDARGNVLPNILVEIKDKAGSPVRAFKTNSLGNFASATPLAVGTYTITLEDVKKEHTFDAIQITANGQVMLPIEIISYDKREELRKELFN